MEEQMYYTYIVASRSHTFYVGMTGGIELRMRQDKDGHFRGYSKTYNCNRLVWFERHPHVNDAIAWAIGGQDGHDTYSPHLR